MPSYSELEAQHEYARYQDSVMTNDKIMTFLEWVLATKTVLRDVPPEDSRSYSRDDRRRD